jgi:hypothetical protein
VLLAQCTLFWEGCRDSRTVFSVGLAGPAVTVGYKDSPVGLELVEASPLWLVVNVLAMTAAAILWAYASPRWEQRLTSPKLVAATALVTAIFNSALYFGALWFYAVAYPVLWVTELLFGSSATHNEGVLGIMSRLYFAVGTAATWAVLRLAHAVSLRYFFVAPDRWQFSLAGLLVLMVILGTGIGMLLRLFSG